MDPRTEYKIRRITEAVAEECGMRDAILSKPDLMQAQAKEVAEYVLKKAAINNGSLTYAECDKLNKRMKDILAQADRVEHVIDQEKEREFNLRLDARIRQAIKRGDIPDPKDDPYMKEMAYRLNR